MSSTATTTAVAALNRNDAPKLTCAASTAKIVGLSVEPLSPVKRHMPRNAPRPSADTR